MTIHLVKLSVGSESFADMLDWQTQRLKIMKAQGKKPELIHITRQTPKRAEELLDGGSLYWVVKGFIVARQRLLELRPMMDGGIPHCGLVYDAALVPVQWQPRRPFQGWRYLDPKDAPPDRKTGDGNDELPEALRQELTLLGLL